MPQQFSIEEMQTQIRDLQLALATPGIPDDEAQMHRTLIARIQAEIRARTAKAAPVTPPPPPTPPQPIKHTAPPPPPPSPKPSPLKGGNEGEQTPPNQQPIRVIAPGKPDTLTPQEINDLQKSYISDISLNTTPPTVTIQWPAWDWGERTYTEREARGALSSALSDLSESKRAAQGRYQDLPKKYRQYWRAIQYYRALTIFWGAPPTRQQLELRPQNQRFIHIFQLITDAAALHENHIPR